MLRLPEDWIDPLANAIDSPQYSKLCDFIDQAYRSDTVYPPRTQLFSAFERTPYRDVKVVLLGQDPYHGAGQANGMSFSVPEGVKCPPSLVNIYKALRYDLGIAPSASGDLSGWARQGVLLLNSVMTVQEGQAGSHRKKGWEDFTDRVIERLDRYEQPLVFLLWGNFARKKAALITDPRHLILQSVHPSPLSFYQGFLECGHFSAANDFLTRNGREPIDWACRSEREWTAKYGAQRIDK